jgi:hypothetical protein
MLSLIARARQGVEADVRTAYQISLSVCPDKHKEEKKARQEIGGGGSGLSLTLPACLARARQGREL